ncbi:MAG: OsmC family peroxiredoxin [Acetobacteraceae bacterium]
MAIRKSAQAHWAGGIKSGHGAISTESLSLKGQPYGFNTGFEGKPGTNPEELAGVALAGCYAMALSLALENAGHVAKDIDAKAIVSLDKAEKGSEVKHIALEVQVSAPDLDQEKFMQLANMTKENCPISKLFRAQITLSARLDPS